MAAVLKRRKVRKEKGDILFLPAYVLPSLHSSSKSLETYPIQILKFINLE